MMKILYILCYFTLNKTLIYSHSLSLYAISPCIFKPRMFSNARHHHSINAPISCCGFRTLIKYTKRCLSRWLKSNLTIKFKDFFSIPKIQLLRAIRCRRIPIVAPIVSKALFNNTRVPSYTPSSM